MLLEPSAGDKPLDWPVVYRGLPRSESDAEGVSVWPVDISKVVDALAVLGGRDKPDMVKSLLGKPGMYAYSGACGIATVGLSSVEAPSSHQACSSICSDIGT